MDDTRAVIKELRRIADAGERIARALEKQGRVINYSPTILSDADNAAKVKEWVDNSIRSILNKLENET